MSFFKRTLIGFLVFGTLIQPTLARTYPDVPFGHKHHTAIAALTDTDIIQGYPNGEFHPEGLINRAEAVKILTKSKFPADTIENALDWHIRLNHQFVIFPDVPTKHWYSKYVEVSYQNQVIQGYPDGYFRPANNINFAEALKVILETYKVDFSQNVYRPNKLLLVERGQWFEKYFTYAYDHNLINQNKFYHPGQLITRGEFVEVIYRLEDMLQKNLPEFVATKLPTSNEYKITIPKLNIINVDVSFASVSDPIAALGVLKNGLGHYLSAPDQKRKMVLFGHSSGYSWDHSSYKTILREINKVSNGDRIYINYKERGYVFEVYNSEIIPAAQDQKLVQDQQTHELALYTCWPPNSIVQRYIVYGRPI